MLLSKKQVSNFRVRPAKYSSALFVMILCVIKWCAAQPLPSLQLVPFSSGYADPLDIANCGDSRLFIVQQRGKIYICDAAGNKSAKPFLDISSKVNKKGSVAGLLGLVFHPHYAANGYFYVDYVDKNKNIHISRFNVSATDPNKADSLSELKLLNIPAPESHHNGGCLRFGPDGYLYIGMGDGDAEADPNRYAQDPGTLLGKMLRIDVNKGTKYKSPKSNPFYNTPGYKKEIWALGMRNPWRYSFDQVTGDLWIGDVGQDNWEELDYQPASSHGGENYGWSCYEGNDPFDSVDCSDISNYTFPLVEYPHQDDTGDCCVIGGYVYRGTHYPNMYGRYIYDDYCSGNFKIIYNNGSGWQNSVLLDADDFSYVSFGVDQSGELYAINQTTGTIYRVTDASQVAERTESFLNDQYLNLYPNPNSGQFKIDWFATQNETCNLEVLNIMGQIIFSEKLTAQKGWNRWMVAPAQLSTGNYLLQVRSPDGCVRRKFLVE